MHFCGTMVGAFNLCLSLFLQVLRNDFKVIPQFRQSFHLFSVSKKVQVVKVADFSFARVKAQTGVMTAESGTCRWMAPEAFVAVGKQEGIKG
ncbi:hypothetical protein L1887_30168 [Cichorium endivia]|nr:hypothetical protein L1887_30168 [Cichorium endivia]